MLSPDVPEFVPREFQNAEVSSKVQYSAQGGHLNADVSVDYHHIQNYSPHPYSQPPPSSPDHTLYNQNSNRGNVTVDNCGPWQRVTPSNNCGSQHNAYQPKYTSASDGNWRKRSKENWNLNRYAREETVRNGMKKKEDTGRLLSNEATQIGKQSDLDRNHCPTFDDGSSGMYQKSKRVPYVKKNSLPQGDERGQNSVHASEPYSSVRRKLKVDKEVNQESFQEQSKKNASARRNEAHSSSHVNEVGAFDRGKHVPIQKKINPQEKVGATTCGKGRVNFHEKVDWSESATRARYQKNDVSYKRILSRKREDKIVGERSDPIVNLNPSQADEQWPSLSKAYRPNSFGVKSEDNAWVKGDNCHKESVTWPRSSPEKISLNTQPSSNPRESKISGSKSVSVEGYERDEGYNGRRNQRPLKDKVVAGNKGYSIPSNEPHQPKERIRQSKTRWPDKVMSQDGGSKELRHERTFKERNDRYDNGEERSQSRGKHKDKMDWRQRDDVDRYDNAEERSQSRGKQKDKMDWRHRDDVDRSDKSKQQVTQASNAKECEKTAKNVQFNSEEHNSAMEEDSSEWQTKKKRKPKPRELREEKLSANMRDISKYKEKRIEDKTFGNKLRKPRKYAENNETTLYSKNRNENREISVRFKTDETRGLNSRFKTDKETRGLNSRFKSMKESSEVNVRYKTNKDDREASERYRYQKESREAIARSRIKKESEEIVDKSRSKMKSKVNVSSTVTKEKANISAMVMLGTGKKDFAKTRNKGDYDQKYTHGNEYSKTTGASKVSSLQKPPVSFSGKENVTVEDEATRIAIDERKARRKEEKMRKRESKIKKAQALMLSDTKVTMVTKDMLDMVYQGTSQLSKKSNGNKSENESNRKRLLLSDDRSFEFSLDDYPTLMKTDSKVTMVSEDFIESVLDDSDQEQLETFQSDEEEEFLNAYNAYLREKELSRRREAQNFLPGPHIRKSNLSNINLKEVVTKGRISLVKVPSEVTREAVEPLASMSTIPSYSKALLASPKTKIVKKPTPGITTETTKKVASPKKKVKTKDDVTFDLMDAITNKKVKRRGRNAVDLMTALNKKTNTRNRIELDLLEAAAKNRSKGKELLDALDPTLSQKEENEVSSKRGEDGGLLFLKKLKVKRTAKPRSEVVVKRGKQREGQQKKKLTTLKKAMKRAKQMQVENLLSVMQEAKRLQGNTVSSGIAISDGSCAISESSTQQIGSLETTPDISKSTETNVADNVLEMEHIPNDAVSVENSKNTLPIIDVDKTPEHEDCTDLVCDKESKSVENKKCPDDASSEQETDKPNIPLPERGNDVISPKFLENCQKMREEIQILWNPVHQRKFREYCTHMITPEVNLAAKELIRTLVRFQERQFQRDPVKARIRRRYVCGLKATTKSMGKLSCIIVAPDIEPCKGPDALDEVVEKMLNQANTHGVPVVFALTGKRIGRLCLKKVGVSCIGIINYHGAQDIFHQLMELIPEAQKLYQELVDRGSRTVPTGDGESSDEEPISELQVTGDETVTPNVTDSTTDPQNTREEVIASTVAVLNEIIVKDLSPSFEDTSKDGLLETTTLLPDKEEKESLPYIPTGDGESPDVEPISELQVTGDETVTPNVTDSTTDPQNTREEVIASTVAVLNEIIMKDSSPAFEDTSKDGLLETATLLPDKEEESVPYIQDIEEEVMLSGAVISSESVDKDSLLVLPECSKEDGIDPSTSVTVTEKIEE